MLKEILEAREMIPERKMDVQEVIKIKNDEYLSKYEIIFYLHFLKHILPV